MFSFQKIHGLRIQYASVNKFVETVPFHKIVTPVAPILALPENVCNLDFLQYCSKNWLKTFIVGDPQESFPNVHYVNKSRYDLDGISILGCEDHHHNEKWLNQEIKQCEKDGKYAVILTNRLPLVHQEHLLRFPVKAWLAGKNYQSVHTNIKNDYGYIQIAVNSNKDYAPDRYIVLHSNYLRPDESSISFENILGRILDWKLARL